VKERRLAWATDIHLNFVDGDAEPFGPRIADHDDA
jgi:hypothetical protein